MDAERERLTEPTTVRFTEAEADRIRAAAAREGYASLSPWLRQAFLAYERGVRATGWELPDDDEVREAVAAVRRRYKCSSDREAMRMVLVRAGELVEAGTDLFSEALLAPSEAPSRGRKARR